MIKVPVRQAGKMKLLVMLAETEQFGHPPNLL